MSHDYFHDYLIFMAWQMIWIVPLSGLIVYFTAPFHCYTLFLKRFYPEEYKAWCEFKEDGP